MKRTCRVLGCESNLRPGLLMCPDCWRTIPRKMRQDWRAAHKRGTAEFLASTRELLRHASATKAPLLPEPTP